MFWLLPAAGADHASVCFRRDVVSGRFRIGLEHRAARRAELRLVLPQAGDDAANVWNLATAKSEDVRRAGHSLGEFSALVANGVLQFEDALKLVSIRAKAMQKACELQPSTMAAVLALADEKVEEICAAVSADTGEVVVAANYNCPGQLVISGSVKGIEIACERMKAAGAKRALVLPVGGAFHSPLMAPAKEELAAAIEATVFNNAVCPVYQNVIAKAVSDAAIIRQNLIDQLTGAVRWTQSVQAMVADGATNFTECGPGKVLQGLVQKIFKEAVVTGIN